MPTNTDLVSQLPADFEVFGQAVDTSLMDLKGGTTGQILAKNSNTDMDFVWTSANPGDITGITASSPLTGGGTSGDVTVGIQDGTTAQKGAVQLEDSTSSTSTTTAAVPASVKSAYDLANGAIPKTLIDAAGDLIIGTAADTAGRLAIGTNGQVLTSNGTTATWAAAGGALTISQIATGSLSGSSVTISSLSSYDDLYLTVYGVTLSANNKVWLRINNSSSAFYTLQGNAGTAAEAKRVNKVNDSEFSPYYGLRNVGGENALTYRLTNCKNAGFTNVAAVFGYDNDTAVGAFESWQGIFTSAVAVSSLVILPQSGTFSGGTYILWGA